MAATALLPAAHAFAALTIQEYAVPASNNPVGITTGPDGNMWLRWTAATRYTK